MPQGINIDITAKQLIVGVISIAGTVIGLVWLVMTSYMSYSTHAQYETTLDKVNTYTDNDILVKERSSVALATIAKQQQDNYDKLSNEIAKSQEEQLKLRRTILRVDASNLTSKEKTELSLIEELMVEKGYLDPDNKTNLN